MLYDEIKKGESINMEFKISLPKKSEKYIKTIVAFANTSGGKLIIGIDDNTTQIIGVNDDVFQVMDAISNTISDMCTPQIVPNVSIQTIDGKTLIVIEVNRGMSTPYYIKSLGKENGTYIRVGATSRLADETTLKDLELQGARKSFDELIFQDGSFSMGNSQKLCEDIQQYMVKGSPNGFDIPKVTIKNLENWKILSRVGDNLYSTNAFALLTDNPFDFATIKCALFKGIDRAIFLDHCEFTGNIYNQVEKAYNFVLEHINLTSTFNGIIRKDEYEIPCKAIKEAIVNAVIHRNYLEKSRIDISIYDDRVEITSPGLLYGGLTVDDIKQGYSKIRNVLIAKIFYQMHLMEQWGTGIQRIISDCKEFNLNEPMFIQHSNFFRVTIFRPVKKPIKKADKLTQKKADRINLIKDYLSKNKTISNSQAQELLGLSQSTVKRFLTDLVKDNILIAIGENKSRVYSIK